MMYPGYFAKNVKTCDIFQEHRVIVSAGDSIYERRDPEGQYENAGNKKGLLERLKNKLSGLFFS